MSRAQPDAVPEFADPPARLGDNEVSRRGAGADLTRSRGSVGTRAKGERRLALPALVPPGRGEAHEETTSAPALEPAPGTAPKEIGFDDLRRINTRRGLVELLRRKRVRLGDVLQTLRYEEDLEELQVELVKMQRWAQEKGRRVAVLFEGRDAAGKGGAIRRFTEHLNPRAMRVVALPVPTEQERGQWYFQRYSRQLPNAGEIVFFDRSWYNRAVVEPVNGFCGDDQYQRFMQQVPEYEHMLYEDGVTIVKFWFSISKEEQLRRFQSRKTNALKQWKLSPIDNQAQDRWDVYTRFKEEMLGRTHTSFSPWIIVRANDKKRARVESIRYLLSLLPYAGKGSAAVDLAPDPDVVSRYHRAAANQD
jgi:polyphosphate kinase 2